MRGLGVERETLASMLLQYGEDGLSERALSLSDEELRRVGTLGGYYAFSEDAMALGGSMGGARALALATIDVLENTGRELRRHHSDRELAMGWPEHPTELERTRDRELRLRAPEKQLPNSYRW